MKDSSLVILLVFEQHNSWLCGRPPKLRDFTSQTPDHKIPIASTGQQCDLATYIPKCPLGGWFHPIPSSLAGKESTCNAGHPSSIPGSGRSNGEGTGYPLHYSWASLVAQLVENLTAMQETWVQSLGWEDPMEKRMATHSSFLSWRIPWTV